jgi:hypothetical protein
MWAAVDSHNGSGYSDTGGKKTGKKQGLKQSG